MSHVSGPAASLAVVIHAISYKIGYVYQAGYNVKSRMMTDQQVADYIPEYLGDDGMFI